MAWLTIATFCQSCVVILVPQFVFFLDCTALLRTYRHLVVWFSQETFQCASLSQCVTQSAQCVTQPSLKVEHNKVEQELSTLSR